MDRNIVTAGDAALARKRAEVAAAVRPVSPEVLARMAHDAWAHAQPADAMRVPWAAIPVPDRVHWLRCSWSQCRLLGLEPGPLPDVGHPALECAGLFGAERFAGARAPRGLRGALSRLVPRLTR